ncbi:Uu.00g023350.m01.CDS01 [Anthostomella pinea]|uniref:Uu.00g023350.m01.CDS01 n=1 Tax=Anthostomella pinea TaxID=933095 RepID=A0AAI8VU66_9PEZI|nr:Uu.00g023350.m01.CDS01 [Anthostomella pinea]
MLAAAIGYGIINSKTSVNYMTLFPTAKPTREELDLAVQDIPDDDYNIMQNTILDDKNIAKKAEPDNAYGSNSD